MIVYDERGNVLDSEKLDYAKGYLAVRKRTRHHPAVEAAEEEGHLETLAEYPETGGRDVRWVVDVPKPTAAQRAAALEKENVRLKAQVQALSDRGEFMEDCLAEMAAVVYG